ncbi:MAG: hypothetical protein EOO57_13785 [Hymenobacter sp.]|nr:MAG: hypothetical protein EOO57_13785 [Hymenobacter sp.]
MKSILLFCALLAAPGVAVQAAAARPLAQPPATTKVAVFFTSKTTFADLAALRQDLLVKDGIVLNYDRLIFTPSGELQSIAFRVDCRDGYQGSYEAENLSAVPSIGFLRDYTAQAKAPFVVGKIF